MSSKKCFETINKTIPKIHDFILKFYNTKFYVVLLVCLCDKIKLIDSNVSFMRFHFLNSIHHFIHILSFSYILYHIIKKIYIITHLSKIKLTLRVHIPMLK
jgi:hypothetical protein